MKRFLRATTAIALSALFLGTPAQARWFTGGCGDSDECWYPPGLVSVPPGQEKEKDKDKDKDKGPDGEKLPPGLCKTDDDEGPDGRAGKSHVAHVNFAPMDDQGGFDDEETAPWGHMTYFWQGPTFDFVFNGHNFEPGVPDGEPDYVLTYQPTLETLPVLCLGEGEVNDEGDIHIANSVELDTDLPNPEDTDAEGASLVLVPAIPSRTEMTLP